MKILRGMVFTFILGMAFSGLQPMRAQEEASSTSPKEKTEVSTIGISPVEDLMREHGVLRRVLLIYEEILRRMDQGKPFAPETLAEAREIIRRFIEDYHEKLEEEYIFPKFEQGGSFTELVNVLRKQHQAGRKITDTLKDLSSPASLGNSGERKKLAEALRLFIRLYRPHAAREDTVLFPKLHEILSPKQYDDLGAQFEEREYKQFGQNGFEHIVQQLTKLEKNLGIYELEEGLPKP